MTLAACEKCGTTQSVSILRTETTCPVCGASGEHLSPVPEEDDASVARTGDEESATVLLADDDDELRETFRLWLETSPRWTCRTATTGRETLDRLDDTVDVLVLDRRMPGLSGPEVLDRLDRTGFDGNVLVVSAYEEDEALDAGDVAGYLTKPVRYETFLEALDELVEE